VVCENPFLSFGDVNAHIILSFAQSFLTHLIIGSQCVQEPRDYQANSMRTARPAQDGFNQPVFAVDEDGDEQCAAAEGDTDVRH